MPLYDNIQFRTFDYDGFKDALFQLAKDPILGNPQWVDTLESNQGVMFVEWLAFIGANIAFTQNFHAKQNFVTTVTEAKNLTKLAKQFDYSIPNNQAAVVDVTFSEEDLTPLVDDLIIPAGTQLRTKGTTPVIFETTVQGQILAGQTTTDIPCRGWQSVVFQETSEGEPDAQTPLPYSPFVQDTMVVVVDSVEWTQVDNFLDSNGLDEHYRIEVDSDGRPTVIFGDNVNGKIPPLNDLIEYSWKVGGGSITNVSPDTITILDVALQDNGGNPVALLVTNDDPAEGGVDREAIEATKLRIPLSIGAKEATIDYPDFEVLIASVGGVARARILTINDDQNLPENTVFAVILPDSADTVSQAIRDDIATAIVENPTCLTQRLIIVDPQFVTIEVVVKDLILEREEVDGNPASATIEITNNVFDASDSVTINGVEFVNGVDWLTGVDEEASAVALAEAINNSSDPLLDEIEAEVSGAIVTVSSRTNGEHGNNYTLTETDGATDNFTISGATFTNGVDSTTQAIIRAAFVNFFSRTAREDDGDYTVDFGKTVTRNRLIWLVQDQNNVLKFELFLPSGDTELFLNEFPKYTLAFATT